MSLWKFKPLMKLGCKLFQKIYKRKKLCHYNHEIHFLARSISSWLSAGINSLLNGNYNPQHLKRLYFKDDTVDQLYLTDRIWQNLLLQIIKPTFKHIVNKNCYHMAGPTGVKRATENIYQVLQNNQYKYFIRTDIKSFYASILHYKLIKDIKIYYNNEKLINMLSNIINNPIDTRTGTQNPINGIPLRGPLSQFFSAIYLKPLDDIFDNTQVMYYRYQDDILILCKTKRQLNRCKRKMMNVLSERGLNISKRKTKIGKITDGFHFLGITYLMAQTSEHTKTLLEMKALPHARTLRRAREQIKRMVFDQVSLVTIKSYLARWANWWVRTANIWDKKELLSWLVESCWDFELKTLLTQQSQNYLTELRTVSSLVTEQARA